MGKLTGTWTGNLRCQTGEEMPAVFHVAPTGNPIYEYHTKKGLRQVELMAPGQTFRFVPPEGGVADVVVDSLAVAGERISFTLAIASESTSAYGSEATLTQSKARIECEAALSGTNLHVRMTINAQNIFSQPGGPVPGDLQTTVCEGTLRKA